MIKLLIRIEKARRGGHLVPEKRTVTRAGRSFQMTVWVSPDKKKAKNKVGPGQLELLESYAAKLLAPNGKPSNLTPGQWSQVRTPEFKAWFGDWENDKDNASKVIDENGEPLVVYHGSNEEFDSFDIGMIGLGGSSGILQHGHGIYFMDSKEYASKYGKNVHTGCLSIKNPLYKTEQIPEILKTYCVDNFPGLKRLDETQLKMKIGTVHRALAFLQNAGRNTSEVLSSLGYDGVVSNGMITDYVVFDPRQIETAMNKSLTFSGWKLQGRMKFQGLQVSVENRKGTYRTGINDKGRKWRNYMHYPYGYIRGTVGKDKDHLDCYIGPNKESNRVFIIHQNNPETGKYDEDKVMLGWNTPGEAKKAYLGQYDSPKFFGSMEETDIDTFKEKALNKNNHGKKLTTRS